MRNFISIKSILSRVPKPLLEESPDVDWQDWFVDALRLLPGVTYLESKIQIFEIINGKVELPKYVRQINDVRYMCSEPTADCNESLKSCVCEVEPSDLNPAVCQPMLSYKLFVESSYYKRNYQLLQYIGTDKSLLCNSCPNLYCTNEYNFVVTPQKILYTNLKEGWLCVNYSTEVCDESGNLMIPDLESVIQFLVYYAVMKHFEERMFTKEEQTGNFFQQYEQKSNLWYKKAKAEIILRNINPHTIEDIVFGTYRNLIKIPAQYVYSR